MPNKFNRDLIKLWEVLGVKSESSKDQVDQAYRNLILTQGDSAEKRLAWKALRDPYYAELYKREQTVSLLHKAGFFVDSLNLDEDIHIESPILLTTPVQKIIQNIKEIKNQNKVIVLLTTGAFSPIHIGHIDMLEIAKAKMEKQGYSVVGGYISPSHDSYVSTKYNGAAAASAGNRISVIQRVVSESPWLMVDPWESYYIKTAVNFTDVIRRLESYLKKVLAREIQVAYVYGSDNQYFGYAFLNQGIGVCVERAGFKNEIGNLSNVYWVESDLESKRASSSAVRKGEVRWHPYLNKKDVDKENLYLLRNEGAKSLSLFKLDQAKHSSFLAQVQKQLSCSLPKAVKVKVLNIEDQLEDMKTKKIIEKSISLDLFFKGDYNLEISRLFFVADGQISSNQLVERPGRLSLLEQVKLIPNGEYTLIEDDIASGATIKKAQELLGSDKKVNRLIILTNLNEQINPKDIFDVVDLRDFMVGEKDAGLVVLLPNGKTARAPYLLPYVSLHFRAKLLPEKELGFSKKLWELNYKTYECSPKTVADADPSFQELMLYIGFDSKAKMADVCLWHLNMLKKGLVV
jgi:glycerol-3-phosphate cytidylyltransferase-like family protein